MERPGHDVTAGDRTRPARGGTRLYIKATILGGEEDVAFKLFSFEQVTDTIEHVSTALTAALKKAKPKKASVEFGHWMRYNATMC